MLLDASLALGHPTTLPFEGVVEPLHLLGAANVLGKCFSYVETQNQQQLQPSFYKSSVIKLSTIYKCISWK
jgi:hypothetical protein